MREFSKEELRKILADHGKWVETAGDEGQPADLSNSNLQGANFQEANLRGANFRGANLRDADFSKVTGLLTDMLAGANLSNARMPIGIEKFEILDHVAEISRHARNVFLAALVASLFSWFAIAMTTDVALLTDRTETALRFMGTEAPTAGFFLAMPPILLALFLYLHLYLQRMWSGLATLPAVFPEGHSLDRRAYPWLLTSFVNAHMPRLKELPPPAYSRHMVILSNFSAWILVPWTLALFWLRYLPLHDWLGTLWLVAHLAVAIYFAVDFHRSATIALRGELTKPDVESEGEAARPTWKRALSAVRNYRPGGYSAAATAALIGLVISLGAIEGVPRGSGFQNWVYSALHNVANYYPALEIEHEDVSIKPENWKGLGKLPNELDLTDLAQVKSAQLAGKDLKYARARGAFLLRADLSFANLQGADLNDAILQKADLDDANLQEADLRGAILQEADLDNANLQEADLRDAILREADLDDANLQEADLRDANLQKASLRDAELQRANLIGANLQGANLRRAMLQGARLVGANLQGAELGHANLEGAKLRRANLQGAHLVGANLQRADLRDANFQGANLTLAMLQGAELGGAIFNGAVLRGVFFNGLSLSDDAVSEGDNPPGAHVGTAKNPAQQQLDQACGDELTKLPEGLTIERCS